MKAFGIVNLGLEEYSAKEINELIKTKVKIEGSVLLFECTQDKLAYLCYKSQSLIKICSLLEQIKLKDINKIKTDFTKIIPKGKTFRVKFAKQGDVPLSSQEVEPVLGEVICDQFKGKIKVSMDNPDYIVYV